MSSDIIINNNLQILSKNKFGSMTIHENISWSSNQSFECNPLIIELGAIITIDNYTITIISDDDDTLPIESIDSILCFPLNTYILTDQGNIMIKNLKKFNTINNFKILKILKTENINKKVIMIKKNSLGKNVPDKDMIISIHHQILLKNKRYSAKQLCKYRKNIYMIKYNDCLYNIQCEKYLFTKVNNLVVETFGVTEEKKVVIKKLKLMRENKIPILPYNKIHN
tara:strand:+ start:667 stop:1341 length:675 start_codon:yes stop_codon:yes gene_type:complete